MKALDLTGIRYFRLTVVKFLYNRGKKRIWECKCECGQISLAQTCDLTSGKHKSCGCLQKESATIHGHASGSNSRRSPTYSSWVSMVQRCTNPKTTHFHRYGGRGIALHAEWKQFENFLADMGERPSRKHTIERNNNDGDYEPNNCRWATRKEQCQNRASNRLIRYNNEVRTVVQWCEYLKLDEELVRSRLKLKWPFDKIASHPTMRKNGFGRRLASGRFGPA